MWARQPAWASCRSREGAWRVRRMMTLVGARAKRLMGGGPLRRRVRSTRSLIASRVLHERADDSWLLTEAGGRGHSSASIDANEEYVDARTTLPNN